MVGITELNKSFAIDDQLTFKEGAGGLVIAVVTNEQANAEIALQGAQVLYWAPGKHEPVIWLSKEAKYTIGKSVRGGIPVCWPWFGPHIGDPTLPSHGFARTTNWEVISSSAMDDGRTQLRLRLLAGDSTQKLWPYTADLDITMTIGNTLEIALHTQNRQDAAISITEALHTYFTIGDIESITVHGLEDTEFLDKVDGDLRKLQHGPVIIDSEVDRVYFGTRAECVIRDASLKRNIYISKNGSNSTVVWNPWIEKAAKLGDMGEEGYRTMLCVESGNVMEDAISLAPGESHTLWVSYRVESHD